MLTEHYEAQHHPIDPPDPVEATKIRMEQMNLSRKDLEPLLGSRGRVAEVISRRRALSLEMIRKLHRKLHIPLESLFAIEKKRGLPSGSSGRASLRSARR